MKAHHWNVHATKIAKEITIALRRPIRSRTLRDEGYVTLSPASGDRREKNASLTPAGQTYARALLEPLYALEDAVFARMGDARVQEMMDAIALFNMLFEKETEMIK